MIVSLFKTLINSEHLAAPAHVKAESVVKAIKDGRWKNLIEQIRNSNKDEREVLKRSLPAALFAGRFSYRRIDSFQEPSNLIVIDFDKISEEEIKSLTETLKQKNYVYSIFRSPSGNGIKALIKAEFNTYEDYKSIFCAIDSELGQLKSFDMACSDISRGCFMSYDPDTYINPDAALFDGFVDDWETYLTKRRLSSPDRIINYLIRWMNNTGYTYKQGERNNYLYVLASAMCRYGVEQYETEGLFLKKYTDISQAEINTILNSAYKRNDFGIVKLTHTDPSEETNFYKNIETPDFSFDPASVLSDIEETNKEVFKIARGEKSFDSIGLNALNKYFVLKQREMYAFVAGAKAGKTLLLSYMALMSAMYAKWRFIILTTETEIADYKSNMVSFLANRHISKVPQEEVAKHLEFIDAYATFITNDLDHLQILDVYHYEQTRNNNYQAIIIDPVTNVKRSKKLSRFSGNDYYDELFTEYLRFSKKYCSLWLVSHTISSKERERSAPYVQDAEYGVHLARRCHYGITFYRDMYDEIEKNKVDFHVRYVRTALTKGGGTTMNDSPIEFHLVTGIDTFGYDIVVDNRRYTNPLIHKDTIGLPLTEAPQWYHEVDDDDLPF